MTYKAVTVICYVDWDAFSATYLSTDREVNHNRARSSVNLFGVVTAQQNQPRLVQLAMRLTL